MSGELLGNPNPMEQAATSPEAALDELLRQQSQLSYVAQNPETGEYRLEGLDPIDSFASFIVAMRHSNDPVDPMQQVYAEELVDRFTMYLSPLDEIEESIEDEHTPIGKIAMRSVTLLEERGLASTFNLINENITKQTSSIRGRATLFTLGMQMLWCAPEFIPQPAPRVKDRVTRMGRLQDSTVEAGFRVLYNTLIRCQEIGISHTELPYYSRMITEDGDSTNYDPTYNLKVIGVIPHDEHEYIPVVDDKKKQLLAGVVNKLSMLLAIDSFIRIVHDPTVDARILPNLYAQRCMQRIDELEKSMPPAPIELDQEAIRHILSGDKSGGGHHIPSLDPKVVRIITDEHHLQASTHPQHGTQYGMTANANSRVVRLNTFFPKDWSAEEVIEAIQRPDKLLFTRYHEGVEEQFVKSRDIVIVRRHDPVKKRWFTAHPALNEMPGAIVQKLKAAAI